MNIWHITGLMFSSMMVLLILGIPVSFTLFGLGAVFTLFLWGPASLAMLPAALMSQSGTIIMVAVPMFIFMGAMLERSGIAEDLFTAMHRWFGPLRGGLAIGTVGICTVFAAMTGISATACVTMGMIALPAMLKRQYDKGIALGCIGAGSSLGILIPPSIPFILYAQISQESAGKLLMSGFIPGLMLSAMFVGYIAIRTFITPTLGPSLPREERASWREKFVALRYVVLPIILVLSVLGVIFTGIATPTEASAVGALGTIVIAAVQGRLTWKAVRGSSMDTLRVTCMALWIIVGAYAFSSVYQALGAVQAIQTAVAALPVSKWVILIGMQAILLIMGCFLDPVGILMIAGPVMCPVAKALGFNLIWFGTLFVIQLEIGYLTPPFGMNLFYLRALAPKGVILEDIYRSMLPFIILMLTGLGLMMIFPQISLWLPNKMG